MFLWDVSTLYEHASEKLKCKRKIQTNNKEKHQKKSILFRVLLIKDPIKYNDKGETQISILNYRNIILQTRYFHQFHLQCLLHRPNPNLHGYRSRHGIPPYNTTLPWV